MKKKKSGKGKAPRARAIKDLPVSDVAQVKGGYIVTGKAFPKGEIAMIK